ncbi:CpaB family protein [Nocardioides donggukensis]|uniref:SAF domain-containing protein n=1 Tax=Nocardioides donggukensis TaxID=2774019 RepID=A0A927K1Y9_9ACTN|nr:hypothetical protein [Nocardioides donggukensis]MBD8868734.1 hypothetical protein [Nocardioides donggukensis]
MRAAEAPRSTDPPAAVRAAPPGWRDPRLWIGVALVAGSVVAGARVLGAADDTVEVWAAAADLAPGRALSSDALVARRVRFGDDGDLDRYLRVADGPPGEETVRRPVGAGELVPRAALGAGPTGLTEVPIWARAEAVAGSVVTGSVVDVWVTGEPGGGRSGRARLVLDDVVVIAAPRPTSSFGPGGARQVLVGVDEGDADLIGQALAAARDDRIAITRQG